MKLIDSIRSWYAAHRRNRIIHHIATHYSRAGAIAPYAVAAHEMYLRRKIEDFRDFASKRYLEDRTLTLNDIKQEWLDLVVKPMAKSEFCRDDAKCLKAAIVAITDADTFVGEARETRDGDIRRAVAAAKSGKIYTHRAISV